MRKILITVGTIFTLALSAQSVSKSQPAKKKYEYIYGIGVSPTLDGGYEIVYQELIDSVEVADTVSIR